MKPLTAGPIRAWLMPMTYLHEVTFQITDLSGLALGWTVGQTIMIDVNAAGHGWFVDLTPGDDNEFSDEDGDGVLVASTDTLASGRMDLLTVVMHEIGHVLGFEDLDAEEYPRDLMSATLAAGVRRLDIEADQSVTAGTDYNLAIPLYPAGSLCVQNTVNISLFPLSLRTAGAFLFVSDRTCACQAGVGPLKNSVIPIIAL